MRIEEFKLERHLAQHESAAKYIMGASDCESYALDEILSEKDLTNLNSFRLGYSESQGNSELRQEIASLFKAINYKQIVVAVPQESIFLTLNALLDPGDEVIVQVPCYQSMCAIPIAIGCKQIDWKPSIQKKKWQWTIDSLRQKVNKKTKLIIINSPQNPTGALFTHKEFLDIINVAKENDSFLLSDEIYRMMEYHTEDRLPIGSDIYEKCISLGGLSKSFGLGGLRIGWLSVPQKETLDRIVKLKDYTTLSNSSLSEFVALIALRKKKTLLKRNLGIVKRNLKVLDDFFARHDDKFTWFRPDAGPVAFVKTNIAFNESFCTGLLNEKSVLTTPGYTFGYGDNFFRIGFGRKNLPLALKAFEDFIHKNGIPH
jgi:aspartate/methionine/tyrosine aminotransferase